MGNDIRIPTIKEFKEEVKRQFAEYMVYLTKEDVDRYFDGDEANREIETAYQRAVKDYEYGKITEKVFLIGCTSAVAYCLFYMYE